MTDEQGYNGWKNYETWVTALWIDNDQGSYETAREIVSTAVVDPEYRTLGVAEALKDWMEEMMPDLRASLWSDLLNRAWAMVDFYEIAEVYLAESYLTDGEQVDGFGHYEGEHDDCPVDSPHDHELPEQVEA